ncbi:MAG: hypothetical protein AAGJ35_08660, partial [Myxococcota bacterium]
EMLTGSTPFEPSEEHHDAPLDPIALLLRQITQLPEPVSLRARWREIPEQLDRVIAKALAKKPEERYPSVEAFWQAIAQALPKAAQVKNYPPPHQLMGQKTRQDTSNAWAFDQATYTGPTSLAKKRDERAAQQLPSLRLSPPVMSFRQEPEHTEENSSMWLSNQKAAMFWWSEASAHEILSEDPTELDFSLSLEQPSMRKKRMLRRLPRKGLSPTYSTTRVLPTSSERLSILKSPESYTETSSFASLPSTHSSLVPTQHSSSKTDAPFQGDASSEQKVPQGMRELFARYPFPTLKAPTAEKDSFGEISGVFEHLPVVKANVEASLLSVQPLSESRQESTWETRDSLEATIQTQPCPSDRILRQEQDTLIEKIAPSEQQEVSEESGNISELLEEARETELYRREILAQDES